MSLDSLIDRGYIELAEGLFDDALTTAERLIAKERPEGHVIKTAALLGLEENEAAIHNAEDALELFPDNWMLQNNLGIALTRVERYPEALLAFRNAAAFEDADEAEISINVAALHMETEDFAAALEVLSGNREWGEFDLERLAFQLAALVSLERWDDALAFTESILQENGDDLIELYGDEVTASILAVRAMALFHGRNQPEHAEALAWDALRVNEQDVVALMVLREIRGVSSPFAKLFAIECEVAVAGEDEPFDGRYGVVAETLADAFKYVAEFEGEISGGTPVMVFSQEASPMPDEFCGIVEIIGDDEDDDEPEPNN